MVAITLPDGSVRNFDGPVTGAAIAKRGIAAQIAGVVGSAPELKARFGENADLAAVAAVGDGGELPANHFRAKFAFEAEDEGQITFAPGDVIVVDGLPEDNWQYGTCRTTGELGWFPANYLDETSGVLDPSLFSPDDEPGPEPGTAVVEPQVMAKVDEALRIPTAHMQELSASPRFAAQNAAEQWMETASVGK